MRHYLSVWRELLHLSWQRFPALTIGMFAVQAAIPVAGIGVAVGLRFVVDATLSAAALTALWAAAGAAAACALSLVITGVAENVRYLAVDKLCQQDLEPRIVRQIVELEGIEHLEHPEYLDQTTTLRNAAWGLIFGLWTAVGAVFAIGQLAVSLLLLGSVSPWLLSLLVFAVVLLWCDRRARIRISDADVDTAEMFRLHQALFELATSSDAGKEIRVSGVAAELARRTRLAWDDLTRRGFRARIVATGWRLLGWTVFTLGFVAGLATVVQYASRDAATPGDVVLVVTLAATLQQSAQAAVTQTTQMLNTSRLIDRYLWLRDYTAADRMRRHGRQRPPDRLHTGITLDGLGFRYPGTTRPVLRDVHVTIPAGRVLAVVGEYGSGKSTLVKLLQKFYRPTEGTIRVDGVDLAELDTDSWRARTTAAYQDFGRYTQATLAEAVGLGDLAHLADPRRLADAVRAADAESLVDRLPDGLHTRLGRAFGGVDLSEGQWQKTAIARAAMRRDPLLYVLDEPTASLDAPSEHAVFVAHMERVRRLAHETGAVTVVISHRFSTVACADLILVVDDGRVVEHGTHDELIALGGHYRRLYEVQAAAYDLSGP